VELIARNANGGYRITAGDARKLGENRSTAVVDLPPA